VAVRQRGLSWQADITVNGRRYRADFADEQAAQAWSAAVVAAVHERRAIPQAPQRRPPRVHRRDVYYSHGAADLEAPSMVVSIRAAERLANALRQTRGVILRMLPPEARGILLSFRGTTERDLHKWTREATRRLVEVAERSLSANGHTATHLACPLCALGDTSRHKPTYRPVGLRAHLATVRGGCPVMRAIVASHFDELPVFAMQAYTVRPESLTPFF
jgi:hypothetical protein